MKQFNGMTFLLGLSILLSGAASLINEFILSSLSSMILGNSFVQMALTIGIMLFGTGIGAFVQKYISNTGLMIKFIKLEIILAFIGSFSPIITYFLFANLSDSFSFFLNLSIFSLGFLIGFEIPLLIRILDKYRPHNLKGNLSLIFSLDYFGAFAGTLLWVYFLLTAFPFTETSFIVSGVNFIVAVLTFIYYMIHRERLEKFAFQKEQKELQDKIKMIEAIKQDASYEKKQLRELKIDDRKISLPFYIVIFIVIFSSLFFGYLKNRDWSLLLEQKMYKDPIVFVKQTKYQHLVMTYNKSLNQYDFFINGNIQFSSLDEKIYHDMLVHPIMNLTPNIKNVLIIGGGDGMAAREIEKYDNVKITLIDLDKDMIKFSSSNEVLKKLNNNSFAHLNYVDLNLSSTGEIVELKDDLNQTYDTVEVVNIDAEKFLHNLYGKHWDVIVIDLPDPSNPELVKLYSKEFFMSVKKILSPNGMFVIQSTSPYHAKESFLCIGRTLKAAGFKVVPYHQNVPSFGDWGYYIGWKKNMSKKEFFDKVNSLDSFKVSTDYITPEVLRSSFVFGKNSLKTDRTEINEILYPKLLDIYTNNSWLNY